MTTTTYDLKCRHPGCGAHPNGPDGEARDTFRDRHDDKTGESWFCAEHHSGKGILDREARRSFMRQRTVQRAGLWGTREASTVGLELPLPDLPS